MLLTHDGQRCKEEKRNAIDFQSHALAGYDIDVDRSYQLGFGCGRSLACCGSSSGKHQSKGVRKEQMEKTRGIMEKQGLDSGGKW